jgi:hypothetical protein
MEIPLASIYLIPIKENRKHAFRDESIHLALPSSALLVDVAKALDMEV